MSSLEIRFPDEEASEKLFDKVLIANRGEIAVRIAEACQELDIGTVAIYSEVDRRALHIQLADESYPLGNPLPQESYLNIDKIIKIAKRSEADAIHPGYGFLSENAKFAKRCIEEGFVFIGPAPDVIEAMGDKVQAKDLMTKANVPVLPGYSGSAKKTAFLQKKANEIGYPLMIKAAAGGGGKGMRIVYRSRDFRKALGSASREANSAFGDGRVFLEKYLEDPRHVEIQILGDNYGKVVHLFERECSIQRRFQKIIEETPSPALDDNLRAKMGAAAVRAAQAVGYQNAGTVEFLLDSDRKFYFLEMNTRLQVEHAITEAITGIDIVKWQIRLAAGQPLTINQRDLIQRGHALECRIYAEDCTQEFRPAAGRLHRFLLNIVNKIGIRNDTGLSEEGEDVSIFYDPMLAKLIVHDATREDSVRKMLWALQNYAALGIPTNIDYLKEILSHEEFRNGNTSTHFIPKYFKNWAPTTDRTPVGALLALSIYDLVESTPIYNGANGFAEPDPHSPWKSATGFGRDSLRLGKSVVTKISGAARKPFRRSTAPKESPIDL
ncbi:MAG: acetyl-CoA carboxylase biotin carboxylase subunit [Candidatus Hodarchaeales archaeon]|jgi:acetyl-CoA carboxylase biotin carboxylase subunit